ncbi:YisL family protein [Paraliobacillus sediminis]|uniref:YisL family protein n=1 Tax=Paraliobacillus sediminis TaxID=1885916 RepID=UPI000E3D7FC5|nr:YisL family protein [Paraliobacillus sediminis]
MIHLHITGWVLALILFAVTFSLYKNKKQKPAKVMHMITRLSYLLILYSGGDLFYNYIVSGTWNSYMAELIIKAAAGLWVIACLEILLVRYAKGKPTKGFMVQLAVSLIIVLALGFGRLPWGFLPL